MACLGFLRKSPIEHPVEYPIDRDSKYGKPVEAKDLRTPQLNCSIWIKGAHEGNQEPRRIALELPFRRPYNYLIEHPSLYFQQFRIGYPTKYLSQYRLQHASCTILYGTPYKILYEMPMQYTFCLP